MTSLCHHERKCWRPGTREFEEKVIRPHYGCGIVAHLIGIDRQFLAKGKEQKTLSQTSAYLLNHRDESLLLPLIIDAIVHEAKTRKCKSRKEVSTLVRRRRRHRRRCAHALSDTKFSDHHRSYSILNSQGFGAVTYVDRSIGFQGIARTTSTAGALHPSSLVQTTSSDGLNCLVRT